MASLARLLLFAATLSLAGCGFHMRGSLASDYTFAFKSLYLKAPAETSFVAQLRRQMKAYKIPVATSPDQADMILEVVSEQPSKQILSLNSLGRVQEYQLFYRVSIRAYDNNQVDWLPADKIILSRILPYDDSQILAAMQQEAMLNADMVKDAVAQAVRRLYKAQPAAAAEQ